MEELGATVSGAKGGDGTCVTLESCRGLMKPDPPDLTCPSLHPGEVDTNATKTQQPSPERWLLEQSTALDGRTAERRSTTVMDIWTFCFHKESREEVTHY